MNDSATCSYLQIKRLLAVQARMDFSPIDAPRWPKYMGIDFNGVSLYF